MVRLMYVGALLRSRFFFPCALLSRRAVFRVVEGDAVKRALA